MRYHYYIIDRLLSNIIINVLCCAVFVFQRNTATRLATARSNTSSFQVSKVDSLLGRVAEANENRPAPLATLQAIYLHHIIWHVVLYHWLFWMMNRGLDNIATVQDCTWNTCCCFSSGISGRLYCIVPTMTPLPGSHKRNDNHLEHIWRCWDCAESSATLMSKCKLF